MKVPNSQQQSRIFEGKRNMSNQIITNISIYYFQSITRLDRYIWLQLIFKNFRKLQMSVDVVKVENINRQNLGTSQ